MKKIEKVVCKNFSMFNTSLSTLFNASPKVSLTCGNCGCRFSKRFSLDQFRYQKYPTLTCPRCYVKNEIRVKME